MIYLEITSTTQSKNDRTRVCSVLLVAGSAAATLILYNGTSASDPVFSALKAAANESSSITIGNEGVDVSSIYAAITGTGAKAYIYYI